MRPAILLLAVALVACNAGIDDGGEPVQLGTVELVPPTGWDAKDLGATTRIWTPPSNKRRESITVIVAPKPLGTPTHAFDLARTAQATLRDARITATTSISTNAGRSGQRLEVSFRPDGARRLYHRSHVTLVEGDQLIHVLYTAADPDPGRTALQAVVASIREGV